MPASELAEWQGFYRVEPWGTAVHDMAQAHVNVTLANVNRDPEQHSKPYRLRDFLLFDQRDEPEELAAPADPEAHAALIKALLFGSA
ncbi:DUF4035 domain-containing protein [Malikia sp.]|uniref:phage tail assembly protein T n=1 Tax=Malikia sp. TaxID=2070706 RepID=UPI00260716B8|nr:DUF4035 domain-containing protein [Malikia sp.]